MEVRLGEAGGGERTAEVEQAIPAAPGTASGAEGQHQVSSGVV